MATTTEQRAKFKELRLSGVPREQAQTQAYGSIAPNAPVAWVAPAVTPTEPTPVNVNEQQRIDNQTKRQEMIAQVQVPTVWAAPTLATPPVTPTPVETNPTPVATTPTPVPSTTPVDKNTEIKAKNEAQMALNKQQADLRDQERQKIAQETAQANTPKSASEMYNLIASKSPIADELKTTSSYKVAQNRYQRASKYLTMTPTQLSSEIKGAKLIEWSDTWNDLSAMNPKLVQDATNLRNVNGNKTNIWTYVNNPDGTRVKENSLENQFTNDYLDDYGAFLKSVYTPQTQAEVTAAIYTQDVKDAQNKATSYETELNSIEKDMDTIEKDVEKELTWTGATGSRSRLEKMARKEALQTEYNSVLKSYTTYANKANNLITQNTSAYEKAYTQKQALNTALASAGSLKYQNQLTLQNNQAEFDQKIAQQAQAMNDPTTAISTMIEEYKKLGIPFTRSTQQIIQDFESSGQDLGNYLTELQKLVQEKPEYQRMQAIQQGQMSDAEKLGASQAFDLKKMWMEQNFQMAMAQAKTVTANKWTKLDDWLYTNENGEIITSDELKSAKLMWNNYITKQVGEEWWDCGFYASRGTGMSSTPGGNSKDARIQAFSDPTPQVGWMALFTGSGYDQTYGHIAIVTGVNPDGTINVKESNYGNDKRVTERTVPASSVTGYYNKTPLAQWAQWTQATGKQYSDSEIELFADIAAQDWSVQNTSLKNSWLTRQQLADYKAAAAAGKIPPTEWQKQAAIGILSNIQGIASTDWTDAVGKYDYSRGMGLQDASDTSVLIENLRDAAAFNNLWMIKWPMSDKDIAFLKSVSSKLDPIQSNKQFEKNIVEMYNIAARKAGIKEITKLSDIPKERITPWQVQPQENTWGGQTFQWYTLKPFN